MAVRFGAIDPVSRFHSRRSRHYAGAFGAALLAAVPVTASAQENPATLPPVNVDAPRIRPTLRPKPKQASTAVTAAKRRTTHASQPPKPPAPTASVADDGNGPNNNNSGPPLQQAPGLGKTGTKLADIPGQRPDHSARGPDRTGRYAAEGLPSTTPAASIPADRIRSAISIIS